MPAEFSPEDYTPAFLTPEQINRLKREAEKYPIHPEIQQLIDAIDSRAEVYRLYLQHFHKDLGVFPSPDRMNQKSWAKDPYFDSAEEMVYSFLAMEDSAGLSQRQQQLAHELIFNILPMASSEVRGRIIIDLLLELMKFQNRFVSQLFTSPKVAELIKNEDNPVSF